MTFVRHDVWRLEQQPGGPWHPIIRAYALAVRAMQQRPPDDPTSWDYQAAVHGTAVNRDQFRNQCQHRTWFFLPWHRMYLGWFELIVRKAVQAHPDVDDATKAAWALPYWDYGRSSTTRALPQTFRLRTLPDGSPNPLRVAQRNTQQLNINGGARLPATSASARFALREPLFSPPPPNGPGFGGPETPPNHFSESPLAANGQLEATPHGDVHTLVGGPFGFMSAFDTAPLDPIFWLHHANIDRLWAVWLTQRNPQRRNPTKTAWLTQSFHFHDQDGQPTKSVVTDVWDTVADLDYEYFDISLPPGPLEGAPMPAEPPAHPAEMVGATEEPVELAGAPASVDIGVSPPSGPLAAETGGIPSRVYLNVEDIVGERNPGLVYAVYVTVPGDDGDPTDDQHHVGNVSFFGIEQTGDLDQDHPGGLRFAFDATELYTRLREQGLWSDQVQVNFVPLGLEPPAADEPGADEAGFDEEPGEAAGGEVPPVRVGRVSVYYQ
jgi:tyrosinase